ncbi:hypothetical protein A3F60_03005, partial [Candidatus Roizmanbacteria bacterium RIFCSPHIGHO2_12_FULL_39_8]
SKLLNKRIAEDLTSDVFTIFVKHIRENKPIDNIQAYLFGIAKNVFFMHLRKKYKEPVISYSEIYDFSAYVLASHEAKNKDFMETLKQYLPQLPEKQRIIITMRLIDKKSLSEIARELGKDMNYVKTTQKRAIHTLRKLIACTP